MIGGYEWYFRHMYNTFCYYCSLRWKTQYATLSEQFQNIIEES
jgi:hypothetical protein